MEITVDPRFKLHSKTLNPKQTPNSHPFIWILMRSPPPQIPRTPPPQLPRTSIMQSLRRLLLHHPHKNRNITALPRCLSSKQILRAIHWRHPLTSRDDSAPELWASNDTSFADQFVKSVQDSSTISTDEKKPLRKSNPKSADVETGDGGERSQVMTRSNLARKRGKQKSSWACGSCGATLGQWSGACPTCGLPGSLKLFAEPTDLSRRRGAQVSRAVVRSWLVQRSGESAPMKLAEVNKGSIESEWRIPLSHVFRMEVARVPGDGLLPGSQECCNTGETVDSK